MGILLRTKKIKSSKFTKKKSMKRNNKKSVGLNMRGGGLSAVMSLFQATAKPGNKLPRPPPVAQSTQYGDPLVSRIASQVLQKKILGTHTAPGAQTDASLYTRMRNIRTAIENMKSKPKTPDYKTALSTMQTEKQKLKKETLGQKTYKQVKKDMRKEKRTMKQSQKYKGL